MRSRSSASPSKKEDERLSVRCTGRARTRRKRERSAPRTNGETAGSTPKSLPYSEKTVSEKERLDSSSVETLLLRLETSGVEYEAGIAALCRTVHEAGTEDAATEAASAAHEKLLNDFIAPGPIAPTKGAKKPRYRKETRVRKIRTKTLKGKAKEKTEKYRNLQQKW